MLTDLKEKVWKANLDLKKYDLVTLTWGNVSGINREKGLVAIKPSGMSYEAMKPEDIVIVDLSGNVVEGSLQPSSDTPTHLELYKAFREISGVTHTHSEFAAMFSERPDAPKLFLHLHGQLRDGSRVRGTEVIVRGASSD